MPDPFFRIEMLPALQGDALWVEYGTGATTRRVLIDGGPLGAYAKVEERLSKLPDGDQRVELLVVTHVDTDHIEGAIRLLAADRAKWLIQPNDIWFNGWRHLEEADALGGREGDFLSVLISRRAMDEWNRAFSREAVVVAPDRPLPVVMLRDGMKLTLLSPEPQGLREMADKWRDDVWKHNLAPGDLNAACDQLLAATKYHVDEETLGGAQELSERLQKQLKTDQSLANGSSIAFLAEFGGKNCLFLGDAHADVVCRSIRKLLPSGTKRLSVDAVKMSHHGSRANISEELMSLVDARHFLVSTNGAMHHHPDTPAIEAVIRWSVRKPTLWFNYRTSRTSPWAEMHTLDGKRFNVRYPQPGSDGISIEL